MPLKYLIYLLSFTFLLSACGLETDEDEEEVTEDSTTAVISIEAQNPYLPLTSGTSITYNDEELGEVAGAISFNQKATNALGSNVYKLNFAASSANLGLLFSSTKNNVEWIGVDGPFTISLGSSVYTINSIRFNTPINLIGNPGSGNTGVTVDIEEDTDDAISLDIDYTTSSASVVFDENNEGYGTLPAIEVSTTLEITVSLSSLTLNETLDITTNLSFAKGIGIIKHTGTYESVSLDSTIASLTNLPQTIWFDNSANNNPTIATGSSATFSTSAGNILADNYRIYNSDELNALSWIQVSENEASNTFEVALINTSTLPEELTSVQILFEDRQFPGKWLSGNVTLFALPE